MRASVGATGGVAAQVSGSSRGHTGIIGGAAHSDAMRSCSYATKGDASLVEATIQTIFKTCTHRGCHGNGTGSNGAGGLSEGKCWCNRWSGSDQVSGSSRGHTGIIGGAAHSDAMRSCSYATKGDASLVEATIQNYIQNLHPQGLSR